MLASFLDYLHQRLRIPHDESVPSDSSLVELGVDSLVAVDIRSWFTVQIEVEVSVLKVLGGAPIDDLIRDAVGRLPSDLTPKIKVDNDEDLNTATSSKDMAASLPITSSFQSLRDTANGKSSSGRTTTTRSERSDNATAPPSDLEYSYGESPNIGSTPSSLSEEDFQQSKAKLQFQKSSVMSYTSKMYWSMWLKDRTRNNTGIIVRIRGPIRIHDLESGLVGIHERHEVFKTAFFEDPGNNNQPTMGIMASPKFRLERKTIQNEKETVVALNSLLEHEYDLQGGNVSRVQLLTLSDDLHFLVFGGHHITVDGFSLNILLSEIDQLYAGQKLPPVSCHFSDFAVRQQREVQAGKMDQDFQYWSNIFRDLPEPLPLFPNAKEQFRSEIQTYDNEQVSVILDAGIASDILNLCRKLKTNGIHFYLAVLNIFLFRHLHIQDVCIGIIDSNRVTDSSLISTVGCLFNMLPLRFRSNLSQTFSKSLVEVRGTVNSAIEHSRLPFSVLLEKLKVPQSQNFTPLFQVNLNYRQILPQRNTTLDLEIDGTLVVGRSAFDLSVDIMETPGSGLTIHFRSQKALYSRDATKILLDSYVHMLKSFAANSSLDPSKATLWDQADLINAALNVD